MQQPISASQLKWFLYLRKSTDEEDRQVLSLEAQLHEAKEFAIREGLDVVETFVEKKTAKVPGREVFNSMLGKLEDGLPHLTGILAWNPDRLSRNSIDGGRIIYLHPAPADRHEQARYVLRHHKARVDLSSLPINYSVLDADQFHDGADGVRHKCW